MQGRNPKVKLTLAAAIVSLLAAGICTRSAARAQGCHGGPSDRSQHSHRDAEKCRDDHGPYQTGGPSIEERPPHGGQVSKAFLYFFEVVYEENQTHVYIYGPAQEPLPSQSVRGEVLMHPHYLEQTFRIPLKFSPPPVGSPEPNHLVGAVDVSRVRDGDMTVAFRFESLPLHTQPKATFTQTFALSRKPPQIVVVMLTEADQGGLEQQEVCPVTKARLGSMGTPIKVLVGQQPLYLCCRGCVSRPEAYLPVPLATRPPTRNDLR